VAVVQYTFTHKQYTKQHSRNKQYREQHNRHKQYTEQTHLTNWEECGPCPVFASYTLEFAVQLKIKGRKNLSQGSRRVPGGTMETEYAEQSVHNNKNK